MAEFRFAFVALVVCVAWVRAQVEKPLPCGALARCSTVADPVWVTDGKKCYVLRNACLLGIEQCERERQGLEKLEVTTKEKCQKLCKCECQEVKKSVCAEFSDGYHGFDNRCELDYYACSTGDTYVNLIEGPCP